MVTKTINYTDFDGVERTETFRFNLTEAELQAWELSVEGGMRKRMESIMAAKDTKQIAELFQEIIDRSYGCKSADGRRFVKSPELLAEFKSMQAYSDLYMTLATDAAAATEFVNGLVPKTSIAANAAQTAADTANTPILMPAT